MKNLLVAGAILFSSAAAFGQEDSARTNGLPSRIGGNRCGNVIPGANATVIGSLNVRGNISAEKPPVFTVSLFSNGILISRQRVKNGGGYHFACVPPSAAVLVAELDSVEIATHSMGQLDGPPMTNRHDMYVNWSDASAKITRRNEVVSARDLYKRTDENQKLFKKAMEAVEKKKAANALKLLEQLVANDPEDFVAWNELGNIRFGEDEFEKAAEAFEKAFSLNTALVNAAVGAGRAHLALKHIDPAIAILTKADAVNPGSADVNHHLGEAYLQNKKGSLAIVHMRKAIESAPSEKADLYLRIAALYHAAGGRALAAEEYRLFLQLRPDHPDKEKLEGYISQNSK